MAAMLRPLSGERGSEADDDRADTMRTPPPPLRARPPEMEDIDGGGVDDEDVLAALLLKYVRMPACATARMDTKKKRCVKNEAKKHTKIKTTTFHKKQ
jgi:hypothetical protein